MSVMRTAVVLGVAAALWSAPGAFMRATDGARTTADEPQYLLSAISLGEDLDLDISDEWREQRWRSFHQAAPLVQAKVRDDGSRVSPHDPGLALLLAAPMRLGGWLAAKFALALTAGALAATMFWVAVRRFDVERRDAALVVAAFSASAPLAVFATQVYPEIPAALAVTLAIAAITGPGDRRGLALAFAAVVALPWLSVKYAPVAVVLGAAALGMAWRGSDKSARDATRIAARARRPARTMMLGGGFVVAALAYAAAHWAWYGGLTAYASGAHFEASGEFSVVGSDPDYLGRSIRAVGLLWDGSFGLVAWQPLILVSVAAIAAAAVRRPAGWGVVVGTLGAGWFSATFVALTMHGWWFPGRQVVHVLPAAVLLAAWYVGRHPRLRPIVALGALWGASLYAWLVVEVLVDRVNLVVTFSDIANPMWRVTKWLLPDYRAISSAGWIAHICGIGVLVLLAVMGFNSERRLGSTPGRRAVAPLRAHVHTRAPESVLTSFR